MWRNGYWCSTFRRVIHKATKARSETIGNKISDEIVKPKSLLSENSRFFEEIITPPEKTNEILNRL